MEVWELSKMSQTAQVNASNEKELNTEPLPREMVFNDDSLVSVVTYCVLFLLAAVGNLYVLLTLCMHKRRSHISKFILHLAVSDLIVAFIMLPNEIGWHMTVSWKAGDFGCRAMMYFRPFGFYLSSFILVSMSVDRYLAINRPLQQVHARQRGRVMLGLSWISSFIACVPQSVIFHEASHPNFVWFKQCVTFNFFPSESHELAYNLFSITTIYLFPLVVIITTYSLILHKMHSKSAQAKRNQTYTEVKKFTILRRSGPGIIDKAKIHTLKMTIVIGRTNRTRILTSASLHEVCVFVFCWTPYITMATWWAFDRNSAAKVPPKLSRFLFIFAVSNSCANPIVYGMYSKLFKLDIRGSWRWLHSSTRLRQKPDVRDQLPQCTL